MTGDTLFIGDVGRPDLAGLDRVHQGRTADKLYESLHNKLMPLPDATWCIRPTVGSACGKNLSTELWSTIGEQRKTNYALRASSKEKFIELVD